MFALLFVQARARIPRPVVMPVFATFVPFAQVAQSTGKGRGQHPPHPHSPPDCAATALATGDNDPNPGQRGGAPDPSGEGDAGSAVGEGHAPSTSPGASLRLGDACEEPIPVEEIYEFLSLDRWPGGDEERELAAILEEPVGEPDCIFQAILDQLPDDHMSNRVTALTEDDLPRLPCPYQRATRRRRGKSLVPKDSLEYEELFPPLRASPVSVVPEQHAALQDVGTDELLGAIHVSWWRPGEVAETQEVATDAVRLAIKLHKDVVDKVARGALVTAVEVMRTSIRACVDEAQVAAARAQATGKDPPVIALPPLTVVSESAARLMNRAARPARRAKRRERRERREGRGHRQGAISSKKRSRA